MWQVGSLAFTNAPILAALLLLPLIWWILRITPPAPQRIRFPAIRLLFGLPQEEETPARTPLWLLLLRLLLAALIILALAHPLLNPAGRLAGDGPLLLVIDDGWAAARNWERRRSALDEILEQAERANRPVALLTTAPAPNGETPRPVALMRAAEARSALHALEPKPWPPDRHAAAGRLAGVTFAEAATVVWLADGIAGPGISELSEGLQRLGHVEIVTDARGEAARLLRPPRREGTGLLLLAERPQGGGAETLWVRGTAGDGRTVARHPLTFEAGRTQAEARFDLPSEVLNAIMALRIENEASAGATVLLDEGWRRRPVGIVAPAASQAGHPLLDDLHYVSRALQPFADLRRAELPALLDANMAVIVLTDAAAVTPEQRAQLAAWVERGGMLIRFAGPRLAEAESDELLPVRLRHGGRALGGALSWSQPQHLAPFPPESPFAGLEVPQDVTVSRQLLAEPSIDLARKTWASLSDGTPLVTGAPRGKGWVMLVHTTANADWSNLALSGLFVGMLQRAVAMSQGVSGLDSEGVLPPLEVMDGFGRLARPGRVVKPIAAAALAETPVGPDHPPGYYGTDSGRRAFNLSSSVEMLRPFPDALPGSVSIRSFARSAELDLKPWLLLAATLLALADLVIALALRGHFAGLFAGAGRIARRGGTAAALLPAAGLLALLVPLLASGPAGAQTPRRGEDPDARALEATLQTRLAYVRTGVPAIDDVSRSGLAGLTWVLGQRTAVEAAAPLEVEVETQELSFFPLLYWPISPQQPPLSAQGRAKLADYLQNGGVILFDTRDQGDVSGGVGLDPAAVTPERQRLREILQGMNLPPLAPVPPDHVLTKAFYLIHEFPGRWAGGTLWVEAAGTEHNDGVSSVIIGGNDWAAAWAADQTGQPLFPVVPGGEEQREMAYRFGVNLVMHVLTGNYKADQVHVPAILQRLGE